MATTREQVVSVLGPVDEEMIAEIISTGASLDELREAWGLGLWRRGIDWARPTSARDTNSCLD